jgi:hypothetical protein
MARKSTQFYWTASIKILNNSKSFYALGFFIKITVEFKIIDLMHCSEKNSILFFLFSFYSKQFSIVGVEKYVLSK